MSLTIDCLYLSSAMCAEIFEIIKFASGVNSQNADIIGRENFSISGISPIVSAVHVLT